MFLVTTIFSTKSKGKEEEEHFFGMISKKDNHVGKVEVKDRKINVILHEPLSTQDTADLKKAINDFRPYYCQFDLNIECVR
ncbi:hypothetical protein ACFVL4_21255 [Bacillus subtilis]|uniref:hypothetical protein n=1 Tax=Bacillus subtilis group TaxID=653685 RepID=UPI000EF16753|nr:hypothetical protein [Bacillus subtilis]AYK76650.1 hypothetical protein D9C12_23180 [Bacillus subtilis subsp. subtilis]AYL03129.1 hypothetical protein D9C08_22520 [Bacillus subtilis subsp. subtilis]MDK7657016.1 hypothetical protein [Bacillus subtilis]MDQ4711647.1 hypothetical protein [Bacillus subtilis]MEC0326770.1 hypothetical protein [Bacillus subtilis]